MATTAYQWAIGTCSTGHRANGHSGHETMLLPTTTESESLPDISQGRAIDVETEKHTCSFSMSIPSSAPDLPQNVPNHQHQPLLAGSSHYVQSILPQICRPGTTTMSHMPPSVHEKQPIDQRVPTAITKQQELLSLNEQDGELSQRTRSPISDAWASFGSTAQISRLGGMMQRSISHPLEITTVGMQPNDTSSDSVTATNLEDTLHLNFRPPLLYDLPTMDAYVAQFDFSQWQRNQMTVNRAPWEQTHHGPGLGTNGWVIPLDTS